MDGLRGIARGVPSSYEGGSTARFGLWQETKGNAGAEQSASWREPAGREPGQSFDAHSPLGQAPSGGRPREMGTALGEREERKPPEEEGQISGENGQILQERIEALRQSGQPVRQKTQEEGSRSGRPAGQRTRGPQDQSSQPVRQKTQNYRRGGRPVRAVWLIHGDGGQEAEEQKAWYLQEKEEREKKGMEAWLEKQKEQENECTSFLEKLRQQEEAFKKALDPKKKTNLYDATMDLMLIAQAEKIAALKAIQTRLLFKVRSVKASRAKASEIRSAVNKLKKVLGKAKAKVRNLEKEGELEKKRKRAEEMKRKARERALRRELELRKKVRKAKEQKDIEESRMGLGANYGGPTGDPELDRALEAMEGYGGIDAAVADVGAVVDVAAVDMGAAVADAGAGAVDVSL